MTDQTIPKYHVAPNFSIPPIEAGGILQLGSIIASVASADEPLNEDCHVHIPQAKLFCSHQRNFTTTKSHMATGDYGVWAKLIGITGVGGELSWVPERSAENVYHFWSVDTIYFNPSQAYMEESMQQQDVKDYFVGSGNDQVYMVTGLKTARGPSVKMSKSYKFKISGELGLREPGGLPIEFGPKFNVSGDARGENSFEGSTDFIIGIRVKRLMYKKHWLTRTHRALLVKEYNKGATMVDDDVMKKSADEILDLGDVTEGKFDRGAEDTDDEINEITWVIA